MLVGDHCYTTLYKESLDITAIARLYRRRLQSVFIGISFLAEDLLGECIFVQSIDILPYHYILEAPDTQATNESQAFKIHVLNWLYNFYLRSYWLSCCTGSSGGISRHLSLKLFRPGHSTLHLQTGNMFGGCSVVTGGNVYG